MRRLLSRAGAGCVPLALAAGLALTAGACMSPAAKKPSAAGAAGQEAARDGPGPQSGAGSDAAKPEKPWWKRLVRPGKEPMRPGDMEPGKPGIFSGKAGEFVLLGKDEVGRPADPTKPEKVRR